MFDDWAGGLRCLMTGLGGGAEMFDDWRPDRGLILLMTVLSICTTKEELQTTMGSLSEH